MNDPMMRAAIVTAWAQFQVDTKLSPGEFTEMEAMVFQAAFAAGSSWALQRAMVITAEVCDELKVKP